MVPGCVVCCVARAVEWRQKAKSDRRDVPLSQEELRMRTLREVQMNVLRVARGIMSEAEALALMEEAAREMATSSYVMRCSTRYSPFFRFASALGAAEQAAKLHHCSEDLSGD